MKRRGIIFVIALPTIAVILLVIMASIGGGVEFIPLDGDYCYEVGELKSAVNPLDYRNVRLVKEYTLSSGMALKLTTIKDSGEVVDIDVDFAECDFVVDDQRSDITSVGRVSIYQLSNCIDGNEEKVAPNVVIYNNTDYIEICFQRKSEIYLYTYSQNYKMIELRYYIRITNQEVL